MEQMYELINLVTASELRISNSFRKIHYVSIVYIRRAIEKNRKGASEKAIGYTKTGSQTPRVGGSGYSGFRCLCRWLRN